MSETNKNPAEQEQAIHEYLQSLLLEVPEETEPFADNVHKADSSVVELKPTNCRSARNCARSSHRSRY